MKPDYIVFNCNQGDVLAKVADIIRRNDTISEGTERLFEDIKKREKLGSTEIYPEVIMPHIDENYVKRTTILVARFNDRAALLNYSAVRAAIFVLTNGADDGLSDFMNLLVSSQIFDYILNKKHQNQEIRDYFIKGGED
jgi:mannitol/fructose-specific phosphotransferase system IIA component (Ntr-type)